VIPDRYTVGSVTGYRYMTVIPYVAHDAASGNRHPITTWYVYDRYFCHEPVAHFDNRRQWAPGTEDDDHPGRAARALQSAPAEQAPPQVAAPAGDQVKKRFSFTLEELSNFAQRSAQMKKTIGHLETRLDQEELVANRALHELGVAREEKNIPRFMDRFRRDALKNGRGDLMT
jgi:hypothetical protein